MVVRWMASHATKVLQRFNACTVVVSSRNSDLNLFLTTAIALPSKDVHSKAKQKMADKISMVGGGYYNANCTLQRLAIEKFLAMFQPSSLEGKLGPSLLGSPEVDMTFGRQICCLGRLRFIRRS